MLDLIPDPRIPLGAESDDFVDVLTAAGSVPPGTSRMLSRGTEAAIILYIGVS